MITHENIEIIHYFLLVDKAPFKVMLAQLLAEYKAIHTPCTYSDIRCAGG